MRFNQLKAGVALSYISMGLGYIISLIYTPIMLRLLGQSEYGLYNLAASLIAYLGLLNFGFGSAYMRYYSRYKVKEDRANISKLNGMFLIIFLIIGLLAVLIGMFFVTNTETILGSQLTSSELSKAKILMSIMIVNLAISFPSIVFNSHIIANEKFVFQKLLQMIKTIVNPFLVLPILVMGYGSIGMVVITTFLNLSIEIANIVFCVKKLNMKFSFREFDLSLMKEMTVFSSFIFINMIVDQINWNVDKYILGRFHGTISVAVYGLAAQLNAYYLSLSSAISNVFVPRVHKMVAIVNDNEELTKLFTRIGRVQFILLSLISSGLLFFGRPFINLWAGSNYDESYFIVILLTIPLIVPLIQNIGIEIQRAKNMHHFRSWIYLLIALINILVTIPLASAFEGVGAAMGTAFSLIVGNGFLMNWYYHTKVGLNMKYFWKQIIIFIPSILIPIMFGLAVNQLFNLYNIKYFLLCGTGYVIVYCLSMWFIGMNQYEKELIGTPIIKILKKVNRRNITK
jgi:O-antigen/teichoic acid export membrane protein